MWNIIVKVSDHVEYNNLQVPHAHWWGSEEEASYLNITVGTAVGSSRRT